MNNTGPDHTTLVNQQKVSLPSARMRSEGWIVIPSVRLSVCLCVCYHVFYHHAQRDNKIAIPTGSFLHWLDFKNSDFRRSIYCVLNLWRENQVNKPISSVYLRGKRSYNEGHVSTPACSVLLLLARFRLTAGY